MKPTHDWIWVELEDGQLNGEKKLESGLIMTGDNKSSNGLVNAIVKAVGPGKYTVNGTLLPISVKEGDVVFFTKTIALQNKIEYDGKEYILVRDENVMAIA